ncbi:hypothetical protein H0176_22245 [Methylorubrum populi]|uniref:hypothetical protein n=1 Tax=Methylorubrum rhodesianum TaxID=29427 RepID=UPI00190C7D8F|nr:hypothetical protein [Methylorubrum rhodesianum]MBK3404181.1 hypothetical protein [Methylorubrum rhodesianum]MBY0142971.1 hypothetical protein [Methylorubrum populi]
MSMHDRPYRAIVPIRPAPRLPSPPPASKRTGLHVRFVIRVSGGLSAAIGQAAQAEGVTAGAWARRLLLDRLGMQSEADERSRRPLRKPEAHQAAAATALRELATASAKVLADDPVATLRAIQAARAVLVPVALGRSSA